VLQCVVVSSTDNRVDCAAAPFENSSTTFVYDSYFFARVNYIGVCVAVCFGVLRCVAVCCGA